MTIRVEPQFAAPADPSAALDLRHDGRVRTERGLAEDPAGEARAEDALHDEGLPDGEPPTRVLDRDAARYTGAGG